MSRRFIVSLSLAGAIRYLLMVSHYSKAIKDRVEVATPLNSWKRVEEGAFLRAQGVDPYSGDLYHNSPMALWLTSQLIAHIPQFIPFLFILVDLLAGCFLYTTATAVMKMLLRRQQREKKHYAKDTEEYELSDSSVHTVPHYVLIAYLFNPYSIMNCVGQTMTVWSNFLLAGFLLGLSRRHLILSAVFLALEVQQNLYPLVLCVPLVINHATAEKERRCNWSKAALASAVVAGVLGVVAHLNFALNGQEWSFIDSTFGFM